MDEQIPACDWNDGSWVNPPIPPYQGGMNPGFSSPTL